MAGKYGASDLGSDWITVPRKFRGRKPTSSDTELAYITGAEKGLLSRFANANQVGPENIPSYDDSGFTMAKDPTKKTKTNPYGYTGNYISASPTTKVNPSKLAAMQAQARINPRQSRAQRRQNIGATPARTASQVNDLAAAVAKAEKRQGDIGSAKKRLAESGSTGQHWDEGVQDDSNRWKHVPEGGGDDGGTTTTTTSLTCAQKGMVDDGMGGCKAETTSAEEECPEGQVGTPPNCEDENVAQANCPGCDLTKNDCVNGKCTPKTTTGGEEDGDGAPSLNTIIQPDETPMLQELTSDMDLRNMLTNVLNKNNPLFKQARTRALQAMAARGVVNSSMAEEAVMSAVMNVAMPIAQRVIDDLQRVMAANVNASNAFKAAVNQAYYSELLARVDAANTWNLERMKSQQVNWQEMLRAKAGAASIADDDIFKEYMRMLQGTPGYHDQPTWNVSGT